MMRIQVLEPRKDNTPKWVQESWVGVQIELTEEQGSSENYTVSLDNALMALRERDQNAAWFWFTCMVAKSGPTMTFPRSSCRIVPPVRPRGQGYIGHGITKI